MAIRVALGEDNALLRDSIGRVIAIEDGMDLVGTAEDYDSVLSLVERECPDVLVTDIRMPPSNTTKASVSPPSCAAANPAWVWWCSASTLTRRMRCHCSSKGAPGGRTS